MNELLEESKKAIKEAEQKVAMIKLLENYITKKIETLYIFKDMVNIRLEAMTLLEATTYLKNIKTIKTAFFRGRGVRPFTKEETQDNKFYTKTTLPYAMELQVYNTKEDVKLFGFIKLENGTLVKVTIPVTDYTKKITQFKHSGSTSRSKITGMIILHIPEPFNDYVNWSGIHKVEFYSTKLGY